MHKTARPNEGYNPVQALLATVCPGIGRLHLSQRKSIFLFSPKGATFSH